MAIKDKLLEYGKIKNMNASKFCQYLGLSNGFFTRKSGITTDILEGILDKCADLNPDWLLTGKGEMLRNDNNQTCDNTETIINSDHLKSLIEILNRTLIEKDKQIEKLLHIIDCKKC